MNVLLEPKQMGDTQTTEVAAGKGSWFIQSRQQLCLFLGGLVSKLELEWRLLRVW